MNPKEAIKNYFSSENSPVSLSELAKLLGYTPSKFNEWLKKSADKIDVKYLLAIYCTTGCHPRLYNITSDMLMKNQSLEVFDNLDYRLKELLQEQSFFINFSQYRNAPESYSELYFSELKNRIRNAKHSLYVYDYFVNNQMLFSEHDKDKYFKGYEKYFSQIVDKAKDKLSYERIIGIPVNINDLMDFEDLGITNPYEKCSLLFSDEFFNHLTESYQNFGDKFTLSIALIPSRMFSVMIVDKTYLASEYYRVKEGKNQKIIMVPDIIFIDVAKKESNHEILLKTYLDEFRKLKKKEVSPKRLYGWTLQILGALQSGIEKYKDVFDDNGIEKSELYTNLHNKFTERKKTLRRLIR